MFTLLHWYCHRGSGCGSKIVTFTLKSFNIFGDVYTRDETISLCQRDASAQIVMSHNDSTQDFGSITFTPFFVTKWHDRHRYLSIHHVPYLMSLISPRHCNKTLKLKSRENTLLHNICFIGPIILKFCAEHDNDTVTLYATWRHTVKWAQRSSVILSFALHHFFLILPAKWPPFCSNLMLRIWWQWLFRGSINDAVQATSL